MMKKVSDVVVALSGGLDSCFSAALLKEAGWEVRGLHMLFPATALIVDARIEEVKKITAFLDIPLEIIDLRETFNHKIIEPFIEAYLQGVTPNPCVRCNRLIKFKYLLRYADDNGISFIATGHYAGIRKKDKGRDVELWRGGDRLKDQSYFLHRLGRSCISRIIFPLEEMRKTEVRRKAHEMGLPDSSISESREICFIPDNDYRSFVEKRKGLRRRLKGDIIDCGGNLLGAHSGCYRYTIGQRHGLGIASPRPYHVKEIRPETNEVVVGRREDLYSGKVTAELFNWLEGVPSQKAIQAQAQIRYRHMAAPGTLKIISPDTVMFIFDDPQWAVTPGQALVCYQGDRLLGGGQILKE